MSENHYCKRCGEEYHLDEQEPPENASIYWVPHCPACNSKVTATVTDSNWLDIVSDSLERDDTDYQVYVNRLQAYARLYHGRLANVTVEELIDRAKWFDERNNYDNPHFSSDEHKIAYELRKQAREKLKEE